MTTLVKLGPVPPPAPASSPSAATQARATLKGCSAGLRVEGSAGLRCTMSSTYTSCKNGAIEQTGDLGGQVEG